MATVSPESYDYTDPTLATAKWYTDVVTARRSQWPAPYYAQAAKTMLVDHGAPLANSLGDVIGVVDYAIALSDFTRIVDTLSVGEAGCGFTYEPGGAIFSHPNPDYLLDNVFELRDGKDETTIAKLRDDREGVVAYNSTYTRIPTGIFIES